MEAQRLITVSLGKIASSRCQRGGINLHRNLLVASVLHKARTAYMMDAYQHIIASRKQKQEVSDSSEKDTGCKAQSGVADVCGAGRPGSAVAMTHAATEISHAVQEDKENSPPTTTTQPTNSQDKDFSSSVMLGVENTSTRSENTMSEDVECKSTNSASASSKNANCANCGDSTLKMSIQNRPCAAVICSAGKRRRSRNSDSSECSSESVVSPKKAKLDIQQNTEVLCEKENVENSASEILSDTTTLTHEDVSSINDSGVTCKVSKSCDRSEPMQTESTQITSLVTIFNSGFSGLCSRNTTSSDTNSSAQSQPLSCATELKHESVQIPSVIALTV